MLTVAAALVSLLFSAWLLRVFSDFIPQGVDFELFSSLTMITAIVLLLLVVTFLSGFYPAMVLSHFRPVSVLKSHVSLGESKSTLRKYLTIFQFVVAQVFIVATILVGKQLNFLMTKDMGFQTEAIAFVGTWGDRDISKRQTFVLELESVPEIGLTSLGWNPPASDNTYSSDITYLKDGKEVYTEVEFLIGDLNYRDLFEIDLLAGRERLNDTIKEYVINETYAKVLGFNNPIDAVGESVKLDDELIPIVGVMSDFNQHSLRSTIKPMALRGDTYRSDGSQFDMIHFSLQGSSENWSLTISKVKEIWKSIYPERDFELNFMDESIAQFYEQEQKTSTLLYWATVLAILISCLGLLGLVIHTTERRTKEIGIRKVLGASLTQLNILLCQEFFILVGIAFAIAAPIAWWSLDYWLESFAYKTDLSWWIFLLSGISMLLIALVVISIRTISAANTNPVKSLRTE